MARLTNYLLSAFANDEHFEKRKATYLLYILLTALAFVLLVIGGQILFASDSFYITGDVIGLVGIITALYLFKSKQINLSGHILAGSAISMIIIHNIVRDLFVLDLAMRYRIYINMVAIFGVYLIVISFFRQKKIVLYYSVLFEAIVTAHTLVIHSKLKHFPNMSYNILQHYVVACTGIAAAGFISTWLLSYMEALFQQNIQDSEQIKNQNNKLEELVNERTRQLLASNTSLQEFAYIVSHDLKEPLRTISGFVTLAGKELNQPHPNKKQIDEYMQYVSKGTHQMEELISDILIYSSLNVVEKNFHEIRINDVVSEVLLQLDAAVKESKAVIKVEQLNTVLSEKRYLQQLYQNLLTNAIKYRSNERPLEIIIGCTTHKGQTCYFIKDNGIGIAKKYFDTVFQAFKRLHSKISYEGTGIGLAICKKIIDIHKGKIWIESVENEGTTFYFTLGDGVK